MLQTTRLERHSGNGLVAKKTRKILVKLISMEPLHARATVVL